MSQLVMLQGERIDNIEKNVMEAKEFVEDADAQLVNAQKLQKSARKVGQIFLLSTFFT